MPPTIQENYLKELQTFCWDNGFNPEPMRNERLAFFAQLVADKNKTVNLISRKDVNSIIENHIFISAYLTKFLPEKVTKFIDIGTGGGFPGIPLAIMRPDLRGVLVDSTAKKIVAVCDFIDNLKLSNIVAVNARVESPEFIQKYEGNFDLVVSRAVKPIIILLRYALPLVKDKAFIVTIKGGDLDEEFQKAELKYKSFIKKSTVYELAYKPTNLRNKKGKKLVVIELQK
jgi:16S rRNA (guanine527-N7)-methyltransferase